MNRYRFLWSLLAAFVLTSSTVEAASIPSVLIINPSVHAGTFSVAVPIVMEKGVLKKGSGVQPVVRGQEVPAQNDWLATYPDGGTVSFMTASFKVYLGAHEKLWVNFRNKPPISFTEFHTPNLVDELALEIEVKDQDGTHRLSLGRDKIIALLKHVQFNWAGLRPHWGDL